MHTPRSSGTFRRRHYHRAAQLWADLRRLAALRGTGSLSPARRERLMLVVTAVNRCRYCASFHTHVAQLSGLSAAEVALLLDGSTQDAPESEIPALVYARHWAEAAGQPTPELQAQLVAIYGPAQAQAIERVLTMIWIGNLCGNTWDAILFRFSGGRLGQRREG
jgi:AhpD family alkylhydroperoxidase